MQLTEMIFTYTRADAINDDVLLDVTEPARTAGLLTPTALTSGCYSALGCDDDARLQSLLLAIANAARAHRTNSRIDLTLPSPCNNPVDCYALIHEGDEGEAVVTVMLLGED